ncbi:MAG: MmcQ/YjbR family DNA-binding protein [Chitinophagaceae bacterium]|nr:MmcQ/YjbR family DNA-binding protein [Chitinophagaceae bacterium]
MINADTFRKLALSFPDTDEHPHFERAAFRVNKKIFATLHEAKHQGMVILTPADQSVYCDFDPASFSPVPGTWGAKGSTFVDLKKVKKEVLKEAMTLAYGERLTKKKK